MAGKWFLRDCQRILKGALTDIHRADDGDTNLVIRPATDDASQALLINRKGTVNQDGLVECEISVGSDWKDQYENWARSLLEDEIAVAAQGVWVDDDEHDSKTELHPMDVIFGSITTSLIPGGDWIAALATQRGLVVGSSLLAFRFAAASDDRAGLLQEGPPLAQWSRGIGFSLPLPTQPMPGATIGFAHREILAHNASDLDPDPTVNASGELTVSFTCDGRDYGGPGVILGEIATFWVSPTVPVISVAPSAIDFGTVLEGQQLTHSVHIQNVGAVNLVVSIPDPIDNQFEWGLSQSVITPGNSLDVAVRFAPLFPLHTKPGTLSFHHENLSIQSNASTSPNLVTVTGHGKAVAEPQ